MTASLPPGIGITDAGSRSRQEVRHPRAEMSAGGGASTDHAETAFVSTREISVSCQEISAPRAPGRRIGSLPMGNSEYDQGDIGRKDNDQRFIAHSKSRR